MMEKKRLKAEDRLFYVCLAGLLVLRFPVVILPCYGLLLTQETSMTVFQVGTYLLTAVMVICKRDCLEKYHIDRLALGLLAFAPLGALAAQSFLRQGRRGQRVSR